MLYKGTRSSAVAVIADHTAYRTYGIAAEPNHRLVNLYTDRQTANTLGGVA